MELQIRTDEMHRRAEFGVAAHWKYKEGGKGIASTANGDGTDLTWVRQLLDWQRETADPGEFLDSLRFEINSTEVYAFTPKGDVHALPQGATPIDFAYAIHTEVGNRTVGARVNGRLVPLESELPNGDVVEIFTTKAENAGPNRDWLEFVKSPRARNKIRHHFTKGRREESIEAGKEAIARQMRKAGLPLQRLLTLEHLTAVANYVKLPDVSALYAAVGEGTVGPQAVINRLISVEGGEDATADEINEDRVVTGRRRRKSSASDSGIEVAGDTDLLVKLAKCCTPVPGDPILGFVTRGAGVSVHRDDCVNAAHLQTEHAERIIDVYWAPTAHELLPGGDPGRGAGPQPAAVRHHPVAVRPAREHPVGRSEHVEGPDLQGPVHLRDGRSHPPGPRAAGRPAGAGRVRRLPHPAIISAILRTPAANSPHPDRVVALREMAVKHCHFAHRSSIDRRRIRQTMSVVPRTLRMLSR